MKIESKGTEVEIYGAETDASVFQIATSSIAFDTLSKKIYPDPIKAIIRELSCNAYDAHVDKKIAKRPFEVNLPTPLSPEFVIRDYGNGLTDEQIRGKLNPVTGQWEGGLYTTYFASSKRNTNKVIGGFGIGSKSPYSYTDGFTVISRQCGMKQTYSAFVNEQREPSIVRLNTLPTPEEDGLEVRFPVAVCDVDQFEEKARNVFEFFDTLPNINRADFKPVKKKYSLEGKGWKFREGIDGSGIRVIQGMVAYRVEGLEQVELSTEEKRAFNMPLDLFVPIGTLSPAASRETLSTDKVTVSRLRKLLRDTYADVLVHFEEQLKTFKTGWGMLSFVNTAKQSFGLGKVVEDATENILAQSKLFKEKVDDKDYPLLMVKEYSRHYGKTRCEEIFSRSHWSNSWNLTSHSPFLNDRNEFVIVDFHKNRDKMLRHHVETTMADLNYPYKQVMGIMPRVPTSTPEEFDMVAYLAQANQFISDLGNPEVKMLSSMNIVLPSRTIVASAPKETHKKVVFRSNTQYWTTMWRKSKDPLPKDGTQFYVRTDRGRVHGLEAGTQSREFGYMISAMQELKLFDLAVDTEIFSFPLKAKLPKGPTWVNLLDYAEEKALAYLSDPKNKKTLYGESWQISNCCGIDVLADDENCLKKFSQNSVYRRALEMYKNRDKGPEKRFLERVLSIIPQSEAATKVKDAFVFDNNTLPSMARQLKERYPALRNNFGHGAKELITFYVQAIDKEVEMKEFVEANLAGY